MDAFINNSTYNTHVAVKEELSRNNSIEDKLKSSAIEGRNIIRDDDSKHDGNIESCVKMENEHSSDATFNKCSAARRKSSKQVYKCQDCGFMTKKIRQMQVHFHIHDPEKPYQCDICKKSYNKLSVMKRHQLSHTAQKRYLCDHCGRSYTQIMSFKYHKLSHMTFLDEKNGEVETTPNVQEIFNENESSIKKFLCDICGKFFKQAITLKVHKKWHENKKDYVLNNSNKDCRKLIKKRNVASVKNGVVSKRKSFKCSECPFMATRSRDVLSHMYVHTGRKPFNCQICKRWFSKANTLKRHMLLHNNRHSRVNNFTEKQIHDEITSKDNYENICQGNKDMHNGAVGGYDQLPQIVTINPETANEINNENLNIYKSNFSDVRTNVMPKILKIELPKQNEVCNDKPKGKILKVGATKVKEKNFKLKTPGRKRYCCDECPYSSQSSRDLKVHKRRHTGEKPYACTVCDKRFANRSVVKRHILTVHSDERAHKCTICGKGYTQASNLKMHKLTHYDITTGELITKERTVGRPKEKIVFQNMDEATTCLEAIVSETLSNEKISKRKSKRKKQKKHRNVPHNEECPDACDLNEPQDGILHQDKDSVDTDEYEVKDVTELFDSHFDNYDDLVMNSEDYLPDKIEDTSDFDVKSEFNKESKDGLNNIRETCDKLKIQVSDDFTNCNNTEIKVEPLDNDHENKQFDDIDDLPLIFQRNQTDIIVKKENNLEESIQDRAARKLLKKQKKEIKQKKREMKKREKLKQAKREMKITTNQMMLQCDLCHYTVGKKRDLERHMRSHSKVKPFQCNICKKHFSDESVVRRHKLIHLGIKRFSCQFCDKKFSQSTGLKAHMIHHTGAPPVLPYICDLCGNTFSQEKSLKAHRHVHFRGNYSPQYTCSDCGKSFSFECRLKEHQLTHGGERTIPCDLCDKKFLRVKDMRSHRLLHTREQKSICDKCGKFFATPKTLRLHTQCHSQEKPYVCHVCGTAFSRQSHLTRHALTHTGVRTFGCTVCNKWFTQRSALNRHKFSHTEDTPYSCAVCSKRFKMLDNLKKHIRRSKHSTGNLLNNDETITDIAVNVASNIGMQIQNTQVESHPQSSCLISDIKLFQPLQQLPNG